jgi:signal recognition particle receptor subunit beta
VDNVSVNYKIVFSGPVGSGKTTAIGSMSDIDPVTTDFRTSDDLAEIKESTTVAMDYGALNLDSGERVHLYGTPGQARFDFLWEILSEGAVGLVLLVTNTRPDPLRDLRFFLDAFEPLIRSTRLVVGVTGMDVQRDPPLAEHRRVLLERGLRQPVFGVDARCRQDVAMLIRTLLLSQGPELDPPRTTATAG